MNGGRRRPHVVGRRSAQLLFFATLTGCGSTVFLGDLVAPDGGALPDAGWDGGTTEVVRDAGPRDAGLFSLAGRYQMVFQYDPARVICTDDLAELTDQFEMRRSTEAGLADGHLDLDATDDTMVVRGPSVRAAFFTDELVLLRETRRPTVFTGAAQGMGIGPNDTELEIVVVQIEVSDPQSGILRANVQQKLSGAPRRGQCTIDYQLTLYACGVGC